MTIKDVIELVIQGFVALGTIALAVVTVWSDPLRAFFTGPKLKLELCDPQGERTPLADGVPSRWYHLRLRNDRRSAGATNVRVVLSKVWRPGADGTYRPTAISGWIQLPWQHRYMYPQYPSLGPPLNVDLGHVKKGGNFQLAVMFIPNNLDIELQPSEKLAVEIVALADQAESEPMMLEIAWDGIWSDDAAEMAGHLVVKRVTKSLAD